LIAISQGPAVHSCYAHYRWFADGALLLICSSNQAYANSFLAARFAVIVMDAKRITMIVETGGIAR
jgi:hypothetical protein